MTHPTYPYIPGNAAAAAGGDGGEVNLGMNISGPISSNSFHRMPSLSTTGSSVHSSTSAGPTGRGEIGRDMSVSFLNDAAVEDEDIRILVRVSTPIISLE